jgi:hypothetical protein
MNHHFSPLGSKFHQKIIHFRVIGKSISPRRKNFFAIVAGWCGANSWDECGDGKFIPSRRITELMYGGLGEIFKFFGSGINRITEKAKVGYASA